MQYFDHTIMQTRVPQQRPEALSLHTPKNARYNAKNNRVRFTKLSSLNENLRSPLVELLK